MKLVNTPELMAKYLGDSEQNLRALFKPAEDDYRRLGIHSPLHVVIFDEIDAVFKERGRGDGQAGLHLCLQQLMHGRPQTTCTTASSTRC